LIPYGRQSISENDIEAVVEVLRSNFLTQGPTVPAFEHAVATYCGAAHAIAVNSATSALHIACCALGVGSGDLVWTSPITFVASANCALFCGADVDFVDIDPASFNMSVAALAAKLEKAEGDGRLPKVVIPVHMAGQSCDMATIHALAQRYGFRIIEDASHAIGARYKGEPVGSCRFSDISVFSFHPVKIITTGEGGIATTNDAHLAARMQVLRTHGVTRDPARMEREADGPWYYEQIDLGFNYRMTELQGALGLSQMQRLDAFVAQRRALAARYDESLARLPIIPPWQDPDTQSSYHLYVIRIDRRTDGNRHRPIYEFLQDRGIGVNLHYMPVYLQPYYRRLGFRAGLCPQAELYYSEAISIPLYQDLEEAQQDYIVACLAEAVGP
jgi:UDP-4-amino-4,6-dideoxy-N-acetyl-beta-L-altrosamine transaminase